MRNSICKILQICKNLLSRKTQLFCLHGTPVFLFPSLGLFVQKEKWNVCGLSNNQKTTNTKKIKTSKANGDSWDHLQFFPFYLILIRHMSTKCQHHVCSFFYDHLLTIILSMALIWSHYCTNNINIDPNLLITTYKIDVKYMPQNTHTRTPADLYTREV